MPSRSDHEPGASYPSQGICPQATARGEGSGVTLAPNGRLQERRDVRAMGVVLVADRQFPPGGPGNPPGETMRRGARWGRAWGLGNSNAL